MTIIILVANIACCFSFMEILGIFRNTRMIAPAPMPPIAIKGNTTSSKCRMPSMTPILGERYLRTGMRNQRKKSDTTGTLKIFRIPTSIPTIIEKSMGKSVTISRYPNG